MCAEWDVSVAPIVPYPTAISPDAFGSDIAYFNGSLIVSSVTRARSDGSASGAGSIYIYDRQPDGTWGLPDRFDGPSIDYHLGGSVAIGPDYAVAAANPTTIATVHVYKRGDTGWTDAGTLPHTPEAGDLFGRGIAIHNETIVVTAPGATRNGIVSVGTAYVYGLNDVDAWVQTQELEHSSPIANELYGRKVAITRFTIAVGSPSANKDTFLNNGAIFMYRHNGEAWFEQQRVVSPSDFASADFSRLGYALSLDPVDGTTLIAGGKQSTPGNTDLLGRVELYGFNGTGWVHKHTFIDPGAPINGQVFGLGLAIYGGRVAIGTPRFTPGRVSVFVVDGNGDWQLRSTLTDPGPELVKFGFKVAMTDTEVVVAAPAFDTDVGRVSSHAIVCAAGYAGHPETGCDMCHDGQYQPAPGQPSCLDAPRGTKAPSGSPVTEPTKCDTGTYQNNVGQSTCLFSGNGFTVPNNGLANVLPIPCEPGHFQPLPAAIQCAPAGLGRYVGPTFPAAADTPCPDGTFANETGLAACYTVEPGFMMAADRQSQIPCHNGTYQPDSGRLGCTDATPGHYVPDDGKAHATQLPCHGGKYQDETGQSSCKTCAELSCTAADGQPHATCDLIVPASPTLDDSTALMLDMTIAPAPPTSVTLDGATCHQIYTESGLLLVPIIPSSPLAAGAHVLDIDGAGRGVTLGVDLPAPTPALALGKGGVVATATGTVCLTAVPLPGGFSAPISSVKASGSVAACSYTPATFTLDAIKAAYPPAVSIAGAPVTADTLPAGAVHPTIQANAAHVSPVCLTLAGLDMTAEADVAIMVNGTAIPRHVTAGQTCGWVDAAEVDGQGVAFLLDGELLLSFSGSQLATSTSWPDYFMAVSVVGLLVAVCLITVIGSCAVLCIVIMASTIDVGLVFGIPLTRRKRYVPSVCLLDVTDDEESDRYTDTEEDSPPATPATPAGRPTLGRLAPPPTSGGALPHPALGPLPRLGAIGGVPSLGTPLGANPPVRPMLPMGAPPALGSLPRRPMAVPMRPIRKE